MARGHDAVARGDFRSRGQADQAQHFRVVPGQDGAGAGPFDQHRDVGVQVGDQDDPRRAGPDAGDAPDQAVTGDHRLSLAYAGAKSGIEQQSMGEGAARVADDAGGHVAGLGPGHEVEQGAKRRVFGLQPARHRLPLQEPHLVLAQPGVLLVQGSQLADLVHYVGHGGDGAGQNVEDGGQRVGHLGADAFHQEHVRLAQQHQAERRRDQAHVREALDQAFDRHCNAMYRPQRSFQAPPPNSLNSQYLEFHV